MKKTTILVIMVLTFLLSTNLFAATLFKKAADGYYEATYTVDSVEAAINLQNRVSKDVSIFLYENGEKATWGPVPQYVYLNSDEIEYPLFDTKVKIRIKIIRNYVKKDYTNQPVPKEMADKEIARLQQYIDNYGWLFEKYKAYVPEENLNNQEQSVLIGTDVGGLVMKSGKIKTEIAYVDDRVTKAQFCHILVTAYGLESTNTIQCSDISKHKYENDITTCVSLGLLNVGLDKKFYPDKYLEYNQMITIFQRLIDNGHAQLVAKEIGYDTCASHKKEGLMLTRDPLFVDVFQCLENVQKK